VQSPAQSLPTAEMGTAQQEFPVITIIGLILIAPCAVDLIRNKLRKWCTLLHLTVNSTVSTQLMSTLKH
jgi:hypothetical protein